MRRLIYFNLAIYFLFLSVSPVSAQLKDWNDIVKDCVQTIVTNPATGEKTQVVTLQCIPAVFQNLITAALFFAGVVALFFIIYSGIKYISSGGDPKQVESAQKTLTYAILGLLLILLSFFIVNIIGDVTGAKCIKMFGFDTC